jgi:hypothetical protein
MDVTLIIWAIALTALVIVGVVWVLDLQARLRRIQRRSEAMLAGAGEEDGGMAAAVESLAARVSEATARTEQLAAQTERIDATLTHTVQGVGLVRFRAFQDTGGDQSFALALVDGAGDGFVLSALYGRGATRVYAKPIQGWASPKTLGDEEESAIAQARQAVGRD